MALLSIDIGTTGTRAILFGETGDIIASAYREYSHCYPRQGWAEFLPDKIWEAVAENVRAVADKHRQQIQVLSFSSIGHSVLPVRKDGSVIRNGILSLDTRNTEEVRLVKEAVGEKKYFQIRGHRPGTIEGLCKILWIKRNEPENYQETWKFVSIATYIIMRLGFAPVADYSVASGGPFDLREMRYSETLLGEFGIDKDRLCDLVPAGHLLGGMKPEMRAELGLPGGIKVVTGGHDGPCAVLGSGVTPATPQMLVNVSGTFEGLDCIRAEPPLSDRAFENQVRSSCSVLEGGYIVGCGLPTGGSIVRWFRNEFAREEVMKAAGDNTDAYDVMFAPLEFNGGKVMVLPYYSGCVTDPYARGVVAGLTLATSRQEVFQGIIEGVTHELKILVGRLESLGGNRPEIIRAVGGPTRSKKWMQLKADVCGKTVETMQVTEASALGAAILAGVSVGIYDSVEQAINSLVKVKDRYVPRPEIQRVYEKQHRVYRRLIAAMGPVNEEVYNLPFTESD